MVWQAENGFRFRLAGGNLGPVIPGRFRTPYGILYIVQGHHLGPAQSRSVRLFIARNHVTSVVVDDNEAPFFTGALGGLGTPLDVGGVLLYHVTATPPACGP
jgi:hypothetical protein